MTVARKKEVEDVENSKNLRSNLAQVPCIQYLINIKKKSVSVFLDSGSEINAIHPIFAKEIDLFIRLTDVGALKIDGTMLDTYKIVVAVFLVKNKANWVRFFEQTFLIANISLKIVLEIAFLTLSGADIDFLGHELR